MIQGVNTALPVGFYDTSANVRVYVSRVELTKQCIEELHRNEPAKTKLFADILALPGIVMLVGRPYEVFIQKGDLYSFDEQHPRILDLLLAANLGPLQPASDLKQ
jgi:hypothetical protein